MRQTCLIAMGIGALIRLGPKEMALSVRLHPLILAGLLLTAMTAISCRTTVGDLSVWVRPATAIRPRTVDVGDTKQVHVPAYEPEGDSVFVMVRIFPDNDANKGKVTTSDLRDWPEKIKNRIKKAD